MEQISWFISRHVKTYITKKCSIGDWFVLYQMSRNMNHRFFAEFLALLAKRAMEPPATALANSLDDKLAKLPRADGFDYEEDIMDETMAAEARDPFAFRHSVTVCSPEAPYRSPSGLHLSPDERVKAAQSAEDS